MLEVVRTFGGHEIVFLGREAVMSGSGRRDEEAWDGDSGEEVKEEKVPNSVLEKMRMEMEGRFKEHREQFVRVSKLVVDMVRRTRKRR